MKPKSFAVNRLLLTTLLAVYFCWTSGCNRVAAGTRQIEEQSLPVSSTHRVFAGRASLLVPKGVNILITRSEVNQVLLRAEPDGSKLETKWASRLQAIRDGNAEPQMHSSLEREFPGEHTAQFDVTRGTGQERTLERWAIYGNTVVQAQTVVPLSDLQAGKQALNEVIQSLQTVDQPAKGDFRFDGGIARLSLNGRERISAEWREPVFERPEELKTHITFTLLTDVVEEPGKPDTLSRLAKSKREASANGLQLRELRAGSRLVNGLDGEESVTILIDPKHSQTVQFNAQWLSAGKANDAYAPAVDLTANADAVKATDADMLLAQWTSALDSLRFPKE